jgi:IclR family transcriptional regulator, acetate operon repressor
MPQRDEPGAAASARATQGRTIASVDRATDVLSLFARADGPSLGVTEIAAALGLSKAAVHRIVTTLVAKGYLQSDARTRRYALGPAVLSLGLAYLQRMDLRGLARSAMQDLSARTQETVTLAVRSGWVRVYVDQVLPAREVKLSVTLGEPYPLHAGSSSKTFLAHLSEDELQEYLASMPLQPLTASTITVAEELRGELALIRERGYAASLGERQEGSASMAAPVVDRHGEVVAAIGVCGPIDRFAPTVERAAGHLLEVTGRLSGQLGYVGPSATPTGKGDMHAD